MKVTEHLTFVLEEADIRKAIAEYVNRDQALEFTLNDVMIDGWEDQDSGRINDLTATLKLDVRL